MPLLKKLFWLYFLLLIFEGALRKWLLPQLSAPLLLVRDPVAFFIIWEAYRTHKWPRQWSLAVGILAAGLIALCLIQLIAGENSWFVPVYGLRSYLLPFPVAFIMGENLDREDLRKFGICTLWLLLPLTALEVAQYYAEPGSWLNAGAFAGGHQIGYANGHVRASATFSYVAGPMSYLPLAAAFIFYGLAHARFAKRWLLWAACCALIMAVPVTGSRTLVYELAAVVACVGVAAMFGVSQFTNSLKVIAGILVVFVLVSRLPAFSESAATLLTRFSQASGPEGNSEQSLWLRVAQPIVGTIENAGSQSSWLGLGVGYGALAISSLLTGTLQFLAAEEEFPRVIAEFGAPAGMAFMVFRYLLAAMIAAKALSRVRDGEPLAWLLVPLVLNTLVLGVLEQPTDQGFMVISVGFSLAALKSSEVVAEPAPIRNARLRQARYHLHP
jgi:uncharacterized membrane protein